MKKKIVITGASSAIMNAVIDLFLTKKEYRIVGVTRKINKKYRKDIEWIEADITKIDDYSFLDSAEMVIHAAAISNTHCKGDYFKINFEATGNLLKAANQFEVNRFVYISSIVTGENSGYYGQSKYRSEMYIKDNFRKSQMKGNEEAIIGTEIVKHLGEVVSNLQQLNHALKNSEANDKLTLELSKMVSHFEQVNTSLNNTDSHQQLTSQLAKIDSNLQLLGQILLTSHKDTTLSTRLDNISNHINGLNKSLTENNNDKLILHLELIAKKLHAIEHTKGLAQSSEIISQQLKHIVDGIHAMHQELAKASAASVQKANWLTRRIGK